MNRRRQTALMGEDFKSGAFEIVNFKRLDLSADVSHQLCVFNKSRRVRLKADQAVKGEGRT